MKINYDEFAKILNTFLESPDAFITLKELNFFEVEGAEEESLHFHLLLLIENGLICNRNLETGDPRLLGFVFTSRGIGGRAVPIMLTQAGHDFANALHQKPILERLKKEFTEAPFELVKDISKSLLTKLIKDRLDLE
ncbi:DUF2513 domain-containing protein [Salmonella enterica]|nr:DUF2513 domain-containing protein [Salmonella enterica]EDQ5707482.1 DUF2513 domain-containing protein [Salmonella enterica]EEJ8294881.1 DUF2513 domain-containing protein [Salmonella enterica]EJC3838719.1 DUF2513 domain-containing protein [Salmonella enterica]EJS9528681.1 DUF2513 domain-containing protein [Salmonella enterica]